ncbi:hypothetical protein ETW23_03775 [Leisingera sp. NJS201]|uniref:hypothetical protein n=1 Tax=Leisingera sp. NJS201 TaxID=2508306 RepID=UPI00107095A3|nr:hypothetical protein [Leisingera sp. NJS201]QBR35386.1 hypothetical protein ETW23_03775 [Leisingera sp. NJS201]
MTPIVIHGDYRTGKTYNEKALAKHYGAKIGGEVWREKGAERLKSSHLYTSLTPVPGARNIHINQARKDAGIKPWQPSK